MKRNRIFKIIFLFGIVFIWWQYQYKQYFLPALGVYKETPQVVKLTDDDKLLSDDKVPTVNSAHIKPENGEIRGITTIVTPSATIMYGMGAIPASFKNSTPFKRKMFATTHRQNDLFNKLKPIDAITDTITLAPSKLVVPFSQIPQ